MFGYITANIAELKVKDYHKYRSYYCGVCKGLRKEYGLLGRMTLTYDLTFLEILLTGLYEPETKQEFCRCVAHPFKKHLESTNEITRYAADMNLLLSYYQCLDDWQDEKKWMKKLMSMLISGKAKKAIRKYPEKAAFIEKELNAIYEAQKRDSENLDEAAGHFGKIMEELFLWKKDEWEQPLRCMGFFLGKYIYLVDAYEDIESDVKEDQYNPFKKWYGREDFDRQCEMILTMMLSECTKAFELLPIIQETDILRNILYSGAWTRFELSKKKKTERESAK